MHPIKLIYEIYYYSIPHVMLTKTETFFIHALLFLITLLVAYTLSNYVPVYSNMISTRLNAVLFEEDWSAQISKLGF